MSIEAMKRALAALETCRIRSVSEWEVSDVTPKNVTAAISALRTAIQQAESEPVGAREALERIASWSEHPAMLGVDYGSNGVRDYYRKIARDALTHPAPGVPDNTACKSVQKRLEAQHPATSEPVAQWQKRHPVRTGGRWISTDEHDAKWWSERATGWEARALYTHPAPGVPDDVARNAQRYRWLRDFDHWPAPFASSQEPEPVRGADLDAAIDAAMLAASPTPQPKEPS